MSIFSLSLTLNTADGLRFVSSVLMCVCLTSGCMETDYSSSSPVGEDEVFMQSKLALQ